MDASKLRNKANAFLAAALISFIFAALVNGLLMGWPLLLIAVIANLIELVMIIFLAMFITFELKYCYLASFEHKLSRGPNIPLPSAKSRRKKR